MHWNHPSSAAPVRVWVCLDAFPGSSISVQNLHASELCVAEMQKDEYLWYSCYALHSLDPSMSNWGAAGLPPKRGVGGTRALALLNFYN